MHQLEKIAYNIADAARLASVGRSLIFSEIRAGRLRVVKVGRRTIVPAEALRDWLAALPVKHAVAA